LLDFAILAFFAVIFSMLGKRLRLLENHVWKIIRLNCGAVRVLEPWPARRHGPRAETLFAPPGEKYRVEPRGANGNQTPATRANSVQFHPNIHVET